MHSELCHYILFVVVMKVHAHWVRREIFNYGVSLLKQNSRYRLSLSLPCSLPPSRLEQCFQRAISDLGLPLHVSDVTDEINTRRL
jgi:hypothetical protein